MRVPNNKLSRVEVCFTGFDKITKAKLVLFAHCNGLEVRSNVTKNLTCLVCGKNAGRSKVAKALEQEGVKMIMGEERFLSYMQVLSDELLLTSLHSSDSNRPSTTDIH